MGYVSCLWVRMQFDHSVDGFERTFAESDEQAECFGLGGLAGIDELDEPGAFGGFVNFQVKEFLGVSCILGLQQFGFG